ncbi:MAG: hypothetical protein RBS84_01900 [Kiritimatiellia bacterium]|nr:hypothetical protein [Kiritimatiellia bacterium]
MARKIFSPSVSTPRTWTLTGLLGGVVWRLGLILLILYGLAQLTVRTEWFRRKIEREFSRIAGVDVHVGHVRGTESLNLKIRDVISMSEEGGFDLRVVRIRWRLFRERGEPLIESVRVDGWDATLTANGAGPVSSSALGRVLKDLVVPVGLGLPGVGGHTPAVSEPRPPSAKAQIHSLGDLSHLEMRWGTVHLQDARGVALIAVAGLEFLWTTVPRPDGGRVAHLALRAEEVQVANGPRIEGFHMEWIDTQDRQFLSVLEADDWGGVTRPRSPEDEYRQLFDAMD